MSSDPPPPYPGFSQNYSGLSQNYSNPNDYSSYPPAGGSNYGEPASQPYDYKGPTQSYPTQPGAPPPGMMHPAVTHGTVVVSQPTVTLVQTFRESPVRTRCNHCQAEIITGVHYETGTFTWVICIVLWLVGCGIGCCLIPFCVDGCKDVLHTCPNCHQQIARYSRM